MTAATPNDSGAAASRDAARTARRLTDGTLPRRAAPGAAPPPAPPLRASAVSVRPGTHPVPTPAEPQATAPAAPAGAPGTAPARTPGEPVAGTPAPPVGEPRPATAAAVTSPLAGTRPAPTPASPTRTPGEPVAGTPAPPAGEPRPAPAGMTGTPAQAGRPAPAPASEGSPGEHRPATSTAAAAMAAEAGTAPASSVRTPDRPHPAPTAAAASAPASAGPDTGTRTVRPAVTPTPTPAATPAGPPGGPRPATAVSGAPASSTGGPARTAGEPRPAAAGAQGETRTSGAPATPSGAPAAATAATATSAATATGSSDLPVTAARTGVFKEERDVLDFGRITGGRVTSLAVPVAAVGRLPRRKNVIGAETTGSIPVHLLFRDGGTADAATAAALSTDDDGGPDTVAMPAPAGRGGAKAVIPRPATKQTPAPALSARPAPTADPALVERPAAVLPGWVGVVGGLLALAGCAAVVWWAGAVPADLERMLRLPPRPYHGVHLAQWGLLTLGVLALLFAVGGLGRGRVGYAWVLTLFGEYRGTVRRTGLVWASPLLLRRRVDVRLRHWRSEPLPAVDAKGTALDVTVLVVWRVRDTVRAALGVDGHEDYLREQVEAAMARVLSQLPADAFHEDAPTLRDAEAVGEALTRMLSAECAPVGLDVFSAQPTRIEYAPEVAEAMRRRRIAAIDAKHRDSVLTSVVDAVDDVVHRLTSRGLVELDDYERKALVKDLTVAFYTGRGGPGEGA
ncbi:SPFH domain-containing protein [Streptomyces sp. NPDC004435]|uniref:SPFH domain-containing protein n=1 Tax=Streptomyces sp. NPDC004435 TaxID=3364701 RepID=UPI0036C6F9D3